MMKDWILKSEERAILNLRSLYRRYGYTPYKMSRFEEYDLYVRNKDFLISDQIITFSGDRGRLLALKPDVTLSVVKNAPEEPGVVQKVYYNENVYRDYREILQAGLECVGDLTGYEIAEVVLLAVKSLQLLGDAYALDISHMGLIGAVLDSGSMDTQRKKQILECLRRKNVHQLQQICGEFPEVWRKLSALASCRGSLDRVTETVAPVLTTPQELAALEELRSLWQLLESRGATDNVALDFSVGSDLGYYSGVVFRGYLAGVPTSVLSGGQYDRLPRKMGRKARAIGFAIYLDLLEQEEISPDVDTLILHDGSVSDGALWQAASEASQSGSVLISAVLPEGRNWKNMIRFEKGVRV